MKDKIPYYNIVNMFFVGAIFTFLIFVLFLDQFKNIDLVSPFFAFLKDWSVIVSAVMLIVMYEIGFILNRAGSALIAPILTKWKIWPAYEYDKDVSELSESNSKFQAIITDLILTRTHILMYLLIGLLSLFSHHKWVSLICIAIIAVLIFAGRKQNSRINKIRESNAKATRTTNRKNAQMRNFAHYDGGERR